MGSIDEILYFLAAIPSMLFSWAIIHTAFAFHYAHIYYDDSDNDPKTHAAGLEFPGEKKPDYRDFAYFSFSYPRILLLKFRGTIGLLL